MRASNASINNMNAGINSKPFNYVDEQGNFTNNRQTRVYNVRTESKNTPTYQQFNANYAKQGMQPQDLSKKSVLNQTRNVQSEPAQSIRPRSGPSYQVKKRRKKNQLAKKLAARMRVSGVNSVIFSVGTSLWIIVQLPLAVISNMFFGMALAVYSIIEYTPTIDGDDNYLVTGIKTVVGWISTAFRGLGTAVVWASESLFGINVFSVVDPFTFFMITYVVLFAISLVQIFTMYTAYKLARLNPLSGSAAGLKKGSLLLMMIGSSLPLANLLPWFMVWAGAVWLKPK